MGLVAALRAGKPKSLERLRLYGNRISEDGALMLAGLLLDQEIPKLEVLKLDENQIDLSSMKSKHLEKTCKALNVDLMLANQRPPKRLVRFVSAHDLDEGQQAGPLEGQQAGPRVSHPPSSTQSTPSEPTEADPFAEEGSAPEYLNHLERQQMKIATQLQKYTGESVGSFVVPNKILSGLYDAVLLSTDLEP